MNMKRVQFVRTVLNDPVFHRALLRNNVCYARSWVERRWRLAVDRDVKFDGAIRIVCFEQLFREVQLAGADRSHISQPGKGSGRKWLERGGEF